MEALSQTPTPEHGPATPDGAVTFSAPGHPPAPLFVGPDHDGPVAFSAPASSVGRSTRVGYALLPHDPEDPRVYVGMTAGPLGDRLQNHLTSRTHAAASRYSRWLDEQKAAGTRPLIVATTYGSEEEAMAAFREAGYDVVNVAAGGFGRVPRTWTAEEDALLGRAHDAEVAGIVGVSRMTVSRRRRTSGIPAFRDRAKAGRV